MLSAPLTDCGRRPRAKGIDRKTASSKWAVCWGRPAASASPPWRSPADVTGGGSALRLKCRLLSSHPSISRLAKWPPQVFLKSDDLCLTREEQPRKSRPTLPSVHILAMHVQQLEIGAFTLATGAYKWNKLR